MIRMPLPPRTKTVLAVAVSAAAVISCSPQQDPIQLSVNDRVGAGLVVERLDRAYNAGDPVAYFELYDPDSVALHSHLRTRFGQVLRPHGLLKRSSAVIDFAMRKDRAIALVSSEVGATGEKQPMRSRRLLVLDPEDGEVVFEIDAPPQSHEIPAKTEFECPACNYRITASADWLVVPNCQLRTGCLESVAFYSLTHRVCVHLSVNVGERAEPSAEN